MDRRLSLVVHKVSHDTIEVSEVHPDNLIEDDEPPLTLFDQFVHCLQTVYHKAHIQKLVPLLILIGYTFLGGAVFYYIEAPIEQRSMEVKEQFLEDQKFVLINDLLRLSDSKKFTKEDSILQLRQSVFWYTVTLLYLNKGLTRLEMNTGEIMNKIDTLARYIDQMALRCWEIQKESAGQINYTEAKRKVDESLVSFEQYTSVSSKLEATWTFGNSILLAITIYTTIGYGSVAPDTTAGKVATIIYAICGIPLYLIILHKFGRLFLSILHKFYKGCLWTFHKCRCINEPSKYHETSKISFQSGTGNDECYNVPVSLAIGVTFGWMFTCAGVFCSFFEKSWDYFTSFYFFFISLTTIGFGDVTPTHNEDMFAIFGFIMIGLSLVSMCINVVQLKLELLFEEMMITLMEEYRTAQLLDAQLAPPTDAKRSVGFSTLIKVWKRKHKPKLDPTLFMPLMGRKHQQVLMEEWKKKAQMRVVGTQTETDFVCEMSTQTDLAATLDKEIVYGIQSTLPEYKSGFMQNNPPSVRSRLPTYSGQRGVYIAKGKTMSHSPSLPLSQKIQRSFATSISAEVHRASNDFAQWPVSELTEPLVPKVFHQPHSLTSMPYKSAVSSSVVGQAQSPAMFVRKESKQTATSDFKDLLHEIGVRLTDCRNIVTPQSTPRLEHHQPKKLWDDKDL